MLLHHGVAIWSWLLHLSAVTATREALRPRAAASIPDYVMRFAPLVHLDVNDPYFPSDIGAQISNTQLEVNFTPVAESNIDLSNLASLNAACSDFDCPLYLTSTANISDPSSVAWLHGVPPDADGATNGAISCAVIVRDYNNGIVDAFYMYFYAFNLGLLIGDRIAGNHVGDWEHTSTRFLNGEPQSVWYSAHDAGNVYSYDALQKNGSRYLVYSGLGGHANYPVPGTHSRNLTIIVLNDTTSVGPLWDPIKSAYFYTFTPTSQTNGTFLAADPTPDAPVDWLYFLGKWGDKQYNDSNPAQFNFGNLEHTWDDGPTGPLDKDLDRTNGTCPDRIAPCITTTTLPAISGNPTPSQTISITKTATVASTTSEAPRSTSSGSTSASPSRNAADNVYASRRDLYASGAGILFLHTLLIYI